MGHIGAAATEHSKAQAYVTHNSGEYMASREEKLEIERIAKIHDFLQVGQFPGAVAQELLISQAYMRQLHDGMLKRAKAAEEKLAEEMAPSFTEQVKADVAKTA